MSYILYDDIRNIQVELAGRVAIKLHMGERGNPNHVSPKDVGILVEKIAENGGEPFLVDTTTLYKRKRYTVQGYEQVARKHGFGEFEVVIARDDEWLDVDGVKVAKTIAEADSLVLLSHVTGHLTTGMGAAIKNLSMGCVVKDGKRRMHAPMRPVYDELRCIRCGTCVKTCPFGFISLQSGMRLDLTDCPACQRCIKLCPTGALSVQPGAVAKSFREFALAASSVLKLFKKDKILCINSLLKITRYCDCSSPSPVICKDIGYLADPDPLKIDVESARLLKSNGAKLDWQTWEKFEEIASSVLK